MTPGGAQAFDATVALPPIQLMPLLMRPGYTITRWFGGGLSAGAGAGVGAGAGAVGSPSGPMVLLAVRFIPSKAQLAPPLPSASPADLEAIEAMSRATSTDLIAAALGAKGEREGEGEGEDKGEGEGNSDGDGSGGTGPLPLTDQSSGAAVVDAGEGFEEEKGRDAAESESDAGVVVGPHSFRIRSYLTPTKCAACDKMLLGMYHQGHSCDVCGIHVHHKCQRIADASNPCVKGGHRKGRTGKPMAKDPKGADYHFVVPESVKALLPNDNQTIDGALTVGKSWAVETAKTMLSPLRVKHAGAEAKAKENEEREAAEASAKLAAGSGERRGVGYLEVELVLAHRCGSGSGGCATDADAAAIVAAEPFMAPQWRRQSSRHHAPSIIAQAQGVDARSEEVPLGVGGEGANADVSEGESAGMRDTAAGNTRPTSGTDDTDRVVPHPMERGMSAGVSTPRGDQANADGSGGGEGIYGERAPSSTVDTTDLEGAYAGGKSMSMSLNVAGGHDEDVGWYHAPDDLLQFQGGLPANVTAGSGYGYGGGGIGSSNGSGAGASGADELSASRHGLSDSNHGSSDNGHHNGYHSGHGHGQHGRHSHADPNLLDSFLRVRVGDKTGILQDESSTPLETAEDWRRTPTVYQTNWPTYNNFKLRLPVPHWHARLALHLVDAATDKSVGGVEIPVTKLVQREADALTEGWEADLSAPFDLPLRSTDKSMDGPSQEALGVDSGKWRAVSGMVRLRVRFVEYSELCSVLVPPRSVPVAPKDEFSIATFQKHVARAQAVFKWFQDACAAYGRLTGWENPYVTLPVFVVFVWLCVFMDSEYVLAVPTFLLVAHLTNGYRQRRSGQFVRYWLHDATATTGAHDHDKSGGEGGESNSSATGANGEDSGSGVEADVVAGMNKVEVLLEEHMLGHHHRGLGAMGTTRSDRAVMGANGGGSGSGASSTLARAEFLQRGGASLNARDIANVNGHRAHDDLRVDTLGPHTARVNRNELADATRGEMALGGEGAGATAGAAERGGAIDAGKGANGAKGANELAVLRVAVLRGRGLGVRLRSTFPGRNGKLAPGRTYVRVSYAPLGPSQRSDDDLVIGSTQTSSVTSEPDWTGESAAAVLRRTENQVVPMLLRPLVRTVVDVLLPTESGHVFHDDDGNGRVVHSVNKRWHRTKPKPARHRGPERKSPSHDTFGRARAERAAGQDGGGGSGGNGSGGSGGGGGSELWRSRPRLGRVTSNRTRSRTHDSYGNIGGSAAEDNEEDGVPPLDHDFGDGEYYSSGSDEEEAQHGNSDEPPGPKSPKSPKSDEYDPAFFYHILQPKLRRRFGSGAGVGIDATRPRDSRGSGPGARNASPVAAAPATTSTTTITPCPWGRVPGVVRFMVFVENPIDVLGALPCMSPATSELKQPNPIQSIPIHPNPTESVYLPRFQTRGLRTMCASER